MSNDSIEDKLVLARRGVLNDPDQRRLGIALNTSDSARSLYEAGLAFDRMPTEHAIDRELLARVSARTLARVSSGQNRAPQKRGKLIGLASAVLFVSGAAAASLWHFGEASPSHAGSSSIGAKPASGAAAKPGAHGSRASETPREPAPTGKPRTPLGAPSPTATPPPPMSAQPDPARLEDAGSLFKQANDSRKAGASSRALALYQKLQQRFPASPEAQVSLVLSGRLLLASGQSSRALAQFDRYLRTGGRGGLTEEALSGKAQALAGLGRSDEERQVWRTLLGQFPNSVYAHKARERLR